MAEYALSKGDEIWYFIESGDANQREFEEILRTVKADPDLRREYALYESSFIPKKDGVQLQSADLAAWSFGRAWNEKRIPGFAGFGEWKDWYQPTHSITGVTKQGCQIQGMVNAVNGIRVIP